MPRSAMPLAAWTCVNRHLGPLRVLLASWVDREMSKLESLAPGCQYDGRQGGAP